MHDGDVLERHAETVGYDLREGGLVALAVRVRAGEHRHGAGGMHADLARFEQAGARAQRARDGGGRNAAGFDVGGVADAAQLAVLHANSSFLEGKPETSASFSAASSVAS